MPKEELNINKEYEKLFGAAKRINLFDSEAEYDELRQYIITQPQETYQSKELPFQDILISTVERKSVIEEKKEHLICEILADLQFKNKVNSSSQIINNSVCSDKHLFYIKKSGICDAKGYYDEKTKFFYICKDSLVSYDTDIIYISNDSEKARENFLKKICEEEKGYFRVVKDAKCRSASAAASYVLGCHSDQNCWKDSEGRMLSDVYFIPLKKKDINEPNVKQVAKEVKNSPLVDESKRGSIINPPKYWYINREDLGKRSCHAKGIYDKVNNKFIIVHGSELAYDVTSTYRYTASDIRRKKFIQQNCSISKNCYILKKDAVCNSPDEAACFVLGENADGWIEWKSKEDISLVNYFNRI